MKLVYNLMDKTDWDEGVWKNEPDAAYWICAETQYPCALRRNLYGAWNGYVGIDEDHPLFRVENGESCEEFKYIDIHGGVLSTDFNLVDDILFAPPKKLWWISFAAISDMDLFPEMNIPPEKKAPKRKKRLNKDMSYKDFDFMKGQVELLSEQLSFFDSRIAIEGL